MWKAQRARLDLPVAALDLASHGDSPDIQTDAGAETLQAYVEDLTAVATAVDADILVGNSLGGLVVLRTLIDRNLEIDAAVLVGSGAKLGVDDGLRNLLATNWDQAIETLHESGRLFYDPPDRLRELSRSGMRSVGQRVTKRDFLTCHRTDLRDKLEMISVPLLALTGEYDELTPPFFHRYLAQELPQGRSALIPAAAHLSMLECPGRWNAVVSEYVTRNVP